MTALLIPLLVQGTNVFAWQFAAVGDIECNDTGRKVGDGMKRRMQTFIYYWVILDMVKPSVCLITFKNRESKFLRMWKS